MSSFFKKYYMRAIFLAQIAVAQQLKQVFLTILVKECSMSIEYITATYPPGLLGTHWRKREKGLWWRTSKICWPCWIRCTSLVSLYKTSPKQNSKSCIYIFGRQVPVLYGRQYVSKLNVLPRSLLPVKEEVVCRQIRPMKAHSFH